MITREQIGEVLRSDRTYDRPAFAQEWTEEDDETFTREVLKLALAHLDSTRARRVGEAVLRALDPMDESEELTRADRIDCIATSYGEDSWTHDVLLAIAAALRGGS